MDRQIPLLDPRDLVVMILEYGSNLSVPPTLRIVGMDKASHPYRTLGVMFFLHFAAMYVLMYAMVDDLTANVYHSLNQFYMAVLMTASMGAIELGLMGSMYPRKTWNAIVVAASIIALVGCLLLIREQAGIRDRQFIRSMIPHHAGAILMCEQAPIEDSELRQLCQEIISSQQREIDQMKAILERLER